VSRLLVFALLAALACGKKGPPVAPQLVRPGSPENFGAVVIPEGIRLSWNRPEKYSGGRRMNDLDRFVIERAPAEGQLAPFARVGMVLVTDQTRFRKDRHLEWTDGDVTAGTAYLYRVTAVTLDGYKSNPTLPVTVRFGPGAPAVSAPTVAPAPEVEPAPPPPEEPEEEEE
jgi:hypothetical protein